MSHLICPICTGPHVALDCPSVDVELPTLLKPDRRSILPQPGYKPCGTYAGFMRHKRNGEGPCDPCRTAERLYMLPRQRAWRERNAERERERLRRYNKSATKA